MCLRTAGVDQSVVVDEQQGNHFLSWRCEHPFYDYEVPIFHGDHVTEEQGTGFVHTAPAHGAEDFAVGKEHGLICAVLLMKMACTMRPFPNSQEFIFGKRQNLFWSC